MAWRLRFPVDEPVEVLTTHVDRETGNFFVQLNNSDSSKLDELMEEITSFVARNSGNSKVNGLKVGDACLAKYMDEVWYRGQVLSVDKNGYKIYFVDYGNNDFVEIKNVVAAPDRFLSLPPQAFECELANVRPVGGQWGTELLVKLEELILEQIFVAQAVSLKTNNVLVLSLFQDATMTMLAVEPLILAGYLQRTDDVFSSVQSTPNRRYKFLELDNLSFEDVYLSHTENPNKFYCILLKNSTMLQKVMEELDMTYQEAAEDDYPLTSCCEDNPCCAKYSEDDMWYRAIITSESPSPSGEINVKFVDYGNSENVHISNLMELEERFLELPMQALECTLYGIQPKHSKVEWPQDAIEMFEALTSGKHLVSYLNEVSNNVAEVLLFDTSEETKDINFGQVLVDNGKAIAVKPLNNYKKADHFQCRKSSFGIINLPPNSSEAVLVTNADSPSDFYCQLLRNSQDLDNLMNALSKYYDSIGDLDDTLTLPEAGMLCCGRYTEDNGWYRALILTADIANRQVEVLYIDYGNTEVLPVTRIKELKPQFASLPQQAIPCCLYGVSPSAPSWTNQAIQEFHNAIVDKELMITVVLQSESQRCSVSLMETIGEEEYSINQQLVQKGFAISDGEHPGVSVETELMNYHPPPVEVGNYIDIEVTHVDNMDQFWCHLLTSNEEMERLMSNIQDYYDANPPKGTDLNLFGIGSPCCVRFSEDKMWYRGKILEKMSNNRFRVRFVDYGNCEVSSSKSIAVLNPEFMQLPVQSIRCSLINLSSSDKKKNKFIHKFLEMVNGKELVCRMDECDNEGKYLVLILDTNEGDDINVNEEMAAFIASAGKRAPDKESAVTDAPEVTEAGLEIGDEVSVYITSVSSPENFYCQLAATATKLNNLMNNMETFYRPLGADEEAFTNPQVGDACCAMFTEDDGFYRAVVTKVTSSGIEVRYLDYGNSEQLPLSRVKMLNASFAELPAQSFNAKSFSSSLGSSTQFEESVIDKELKAVIVRKDENGVYVVRLSDLNGTPLLSTGERSPQQLQGTSVHMLCKVNEAKITVGKKVPVFITSVTSHDDFFCQLTETSAQLDDLMNEMEEYYRPLGEQEESYCNPQIGEACCAMFTVDEGWYRATVNKQSGTTVDVYYMDYGNTETIPLSRMKTLNQKFTTLPAQGFHACVELPTGVDISTFKDTVLEKEFNAKIVTENGSNVYEVELLTADGCKLFASVADKKNTEVSYEVKEVQLKMGSKEHVYVTFFATPENFFCQLVKSSTQLDELMDRLEEFYRPLGDKEECLNNPQVGDTCCAMFTEDDGWYRAVITKVTDDTVEVRYLDYGNSEELPVSRVKRLLPCFTETNAQGFLASVDGCIPVQAGKIRTAIDGKEIMVQVTDRKSNGIYGVVVYEMHGNRLLDSLRDTGKPQVNETIKDFFSAYNVTLGNKLDICGSHCESPYLFYLQLVKNGDVLENIMTELREVYCDLKPKDQAITNPVVGMFCAAKFPVDGEWYRAQILSIPSPNEVDVCYIDFGNSERVGSHDIKILAPAFHHTAIQAMKCRLQGAKENWNDYECETFKTLVVEQHLIADVKSVDSKIKTFTVELHDTRGSSDLNILDVLKNKTESSQKSLSQEKLPKVTTLPKLQLKDVENVLVESAASLDDFVCQFSRFNHDLDIVADVMYKSYHEGTSPAVVTVPLQVNDVVAALFTEDKAWYRACVSAVNPDGSVEVIFIDYGNSETIPKADICHRVRYLIKELLRYPAMRGVACTLSRVSIDGQRYSWTPRAHEAFVRYVVEKEFRARLSSDSEPYKTILEDKSESIHSWLAREKLVTTRETEPEVVQEDFYEIKVEGGSSCDVYVTSVVNPQKFYVQQSANGEAIDKVMDDLHVICTDGSPESIMNINAGTLCAAQYTVDDSWYRARVTKEVGPDSYEVLFVDYGNTEVLSKERIKDLDPSLLELPAQAMCCCLQIKQPMSWNTETIEHFEQITADKCLTMTVVKVVDDTLLVTIKDGEGSLLNDLFEHKSPENIDQSPNKETVEIFLSSYPVSEKQTAEVYISHLANPGEFYVQFSGTEEELERLAERSAQTYDGPESENFQVNNARQGMFCCARYSEDNAWYRAQVISTDRAKQTATVRFVDHGNTDVVNLSSDLRQLSADLLASPCQAVPCSLAHGFWSPEQCSSFEAAAMDKPLQATFNKHLDNVWMVTLKDGSIILNQSLTTPEESPSVEKQCLSTGDEPSVYIVSVNSPDDVILQLCSHVSALETLMIDIANNPPQDTLPTIAQECGIYCLACFTEDESWYRAKVLECNGDKIKVLYVDHGNEEWLTGDRIAPISKRFSELPEVCIRCTLDLSTIRGTWGETSGEKLVEIYGESELRCQIVSKTDECFSVKLFFGDEDVLAKVMISDTATSHIEESVEIPTTSCYEIKQLTKGDKKAVTCSHIETPRKLWCQFVEDQETLDNLMNRLDDVYSVLGAEELLVKNYDVGTPCCGQFLEDDGWYRAEILAMEDEGVKVRYVDYGNDEVLPSARLRSLTPEFLSTPRQAVVCLLRDIQANGDKWSQDAMTLVEDFISERSLKVEITSIDELAVTGVVYGSLEDEQVSLSELLVEKSFAIEHKANEVAYPYPAVSYTTIPAKVGDKLNLFYVSADSPASIWCQLSDSEDELLALMDQLDAFYGNLAEQDWVLEEPILGAAVCAQFTEDDSWYRAEILETSPSIMVRFVDYGNYEELPPSRVKRLKQEFAVLPKQAVSFALTGVSAQCLEEWSEEDKVAMEELCSEKCYVGEIHAITDTAIEASLKDQESRAMLLDELCEAKLIVKKSEVDILVSDVVVPKSEGEVSCNADVLASSIIPVKYSFCHYEPGQEYVFYSLSLQSPRCIWLQDSRSADQLHEIQEKMQEFYSSPSASALEIAEVGSACCAMFEEHWYRGEVTCRNDNEMAKVFFVDWGNSNTLPVAELKELLSEFMQLPRQAVCVSLSGLDTSEDWQEDHSDKLKELCDSDTLTARIVESYNGNLTVQLFSGELTEKSVNELLEDFVRVEDSELPEVTDSSSEERTVTVEAQEHPISDTIVLNETLMDERPSVETPADDMLPSTTSDRNRDDKIKRAPSPGDSEEDIDDPQAVCQAIDRLLTEIESRTSEGDRSVTPELSDTELDTLEVDKPPAEADHFKTICNENVIAATPTEGIEATSDEPVVIALTIEQNGSTYVPESESNIENNAEVDLNASDSGTELSEPEAVAAEGDRRMDKVKEHDDIVDSDSPEIDTSIAELQEHKCASESDSNTISSSATPYLSPEVEVTDESPSDELSAYLTPPDEAPTGTVKDEQAVLSSPEDDQSGSGDVRTRYAHPEIQLGDIHKVTISHILSPSNFFCQLSRTEIELCHLMETIQTTFTEHTEDTLTIDTPSVGIPCCAQSPEDDKWYRAIISNTGNDDYVNVALVDIGKTLSLPVGRLKAISDELVTSLPRQAVHCSLVDLEPADVEWSADAVTKMSEVCAGKELEGIFRSRHHKVYDIYLRDPENDASDFVNKLLVDLKLAKVTGRDSDSEEGPDSDGNRHLDRVSLPEGSMDDQISTTVSRNDTNEQAESKMEISEFVKEILDSLLQCTVDHSVQNKTHLTREKVDVLSEKDKNYHIVCAKIQDESGLTEKTSDKILDDNLAAPEVCVLETEKVFQDNVVTTADDESTDFVAQYGPKKDSTVAEEEFCGTEVAVHEDLTHFEDRCEIEVAEPECRDDKQISTSSSNGKYQSESGCTEATGSVKEFLETMLERIIEVSTNGTFNQESKDENMTCTDVQDKSIFTKKTSDITPDDALVTAESESGKMETTDCVKEILDSILERETDQAAKSETHSTMEEVDVLNEKNISEGATHKEIQDGSELTEGTNDEMLENSLVTSEAHHLETENTFQHKVLATDDSESTDFLGLNGLQQDVSAGIEEFSRTALIVKERNTNMEEGLRNVIKNGELCVTEGDIYNELSNDGPKQKYFGIDTELDCVDVDRQRIKKTGEESDNGTLNFGVQHEDQQCFVEEQSDKVADVIDTGSERNSQIKYAVPGETVKNDDEEWDEDGKGKEVKTDDNIHYDWQDEAMKLSSEEQENENKGKGEFEDQETVPDEMCPEVNPNLGKHIEDASVDASVEELTAIGVVSLNEMEGNERSSRRENSQDEGNQGSLEILDSPSNSNNVAEPDKIAEHGAAYLVEEGNQSGDEELEEIAGEGASYNINGIDERKTENKVECDKKHETSHGGIGNSEYVQDSETVTMKQTSLSCSDIASDFDVENVSVNKARLELDSANISTEKAVVHDFVWEVALRDEPLKSDDEDLDID